MDRAALAQLIAMRGNDPTAGRPPAANFIPPDWWQGGGPQQQPPPAATYAPMVAPPPSPPPGGPQAQGFPLEGRSRWGNAPGNDFMQEQYDSQTPPPPLADLEAAKRRAEEMMRSLNQQAQQRGRAERIAPRQYGIGQEV